MEFNVLLITKLNQVQYWYNVQYFVICCDVTHLNSFLSTYFDDVHWPMGRASTCKKLLQ